MITIEETLLVQPDGSATVIVPPSVAPGHHRFILHVDEAPLNPPSPIPKAGCLKGIWMSQDFDAPLEDFREYMQ